MPWSALGRQASIHAGGKATVNQLIANPFKIKTAKSRSQLRNGASSMRITPAPACSLSTRDRSVRRNPCAVDICRVLCRTIDRFRQNPFAEFERSLDFPQGNIMLGCVVRAPGVDQRLRSANGAELMANPADFTMRDGDAGQYGMLRKPGQSACSIWLKMIRISSQAR
jgi:hypothetical protein